MSIEKSKIKTEIGMPWLEFFVDGLAEVCREAAIVTEKSVEMTKVEPELIRKLDQQRMVFAQFTFKQDKMTTSEMRELLRLSTRIFSTIIEVKAQGLSGKSYVTNNC